jgi:hypothetical protein
MRRDFMKIPFTVQQYQSTNLVQEEAFAPLFLV